ncbi:unnamed protein product, partial [Strongylus vulgaris]
MLRTAFVLGATGAVGTQLVEALVKSKQFKKIVVIGRRKIPQENESIVSKKVFKEQVIVNFDEIEKHPGAFKDADVGFCALGTTRAKAGKEGFYKVDHDYVVNSAKVAKDQGKLLICLRLLLAFSHEFNNMPILYVSLSHLIFLGVKEFILVSSAGSNENSFFLYPKTKGETERDIDALGFEKFLIMH